LLVGARREIAGPVRSPPEKLRRRHHLAGLIDAAQASRLMRVILKYNGEDLDAPWYVDQRIAANSLELVED
jgi:hypothetical protein